MVSMARAIADRMTRLKLLESTPKRPKLILLLAALAVLAVLNMSKPDGATADAPNTWRGEINGVTAWVTVVPRGHVISAETRQTEPWWKWGNASSDAYLFAFDRPDKIELILSFDSKAGRTTAEFYLPDVPGEGIKYAIAGDRLKVGSRFGFPNLTIYTREGPWQSNGQTNYNLVALVDGATVFTPRTRTDGVADLRIDVYGQTPGLPDFNIFQTQNDLDPRAGLHRFSLTLRMPDGPEFKPPSPAMPSFPVFALGPEIYQTQWFDQNFPPIYFNQSNRELEINSFVAFQQGGTYAINSNTFAPEVDFESPFAYYNFDPSNRWAHLVIRASSYPKSDPFESPRTGLDRTSFRYSWKVKSETRWRYSLQLAGFHPYDREHEYGGIKVVAPDYKELPDWILTKEWPTLSFVESVDGYPGSEGIYFYTVQEDQTWQWLSGVSARPPDYLAHPNLPEDLELNEESVHGLPTGFRGEYNAAYFNKPGLYFSPVDNRLHLLNAQGGVWNLGRGKILRTHNLTGGPYIDGWTRERVPAQEDNYPPRALPGEIEEALYIIGEHLLYSGPEGAMFGQSTASPALFETTPPIDKPTWESFRALLAPFEGKERDPGNLSKWLSAVSTVSTKVSGGQISEIRATAQGFRFLLNLGPNFKVADPGGQARWLNGLGAGEYAVSYSRNAGYAAKPLRYISPVISNLKVETSESTALQPIRVRATLDNSGLTDIDGLEVRFRAGLAGDELIAIGARTVQILAEGKTDVTFEWAPPKEGDWNIEALLDGEDASAARVEVAVASAPSTFLEDILVAQGLTGSFSLLVGLLLLAVTGLAGWLGMFVWRIRDQAASGNVARGYHHTNTGTLPSWVLPLLLVYVVLLAAYFITRFGGYWVESDTAGQTQAIRAMASSTGLVPELERVYPSGYGYAVISNVLLMFTGLSLTTLQQLVYPLLSVLLVLPAWALYRELTGSHRAATLATFLLFSQPEFLFVVFRGSHERVLRALVLISLWLLVRSFRFRNQPGHFAIHIALFYLAAYGIIATNALFGISFILAIAAALILAWILGRLSSNLMLLGKVASSRLALAVSISLALGFLFIFYVYPPAVHSLQAMDGMLERLAALFLATDSTAPSAANPYTQVAAGWTSLQTYFLLSASDYLLVAVTAPIWLWQLVRWLRVAERRPTIGQWFLWLLYGSFAFQGGAAVLADLTGLLGGNLQHRSFPSFAMLAAPLLAATLARRQPRRLGKMAMGTVFALLTVLTLAKATNEPSLSNKWTFYTPAEMEALEWSDQHDSYAAIWVGLDERLPVAYLFANGWSKRHNYLNVARPAETARTFLISDIIHLQSARLGMPLPPIDGANRIYDNGAVQLYRLQPQTRFQQ